MDFAGKGYTLIHRPADIHRQVSLNGREGKNLATRDLDTPEAGPCETFRFGAQDLARNFLQLWKHPLGPGTSEFRTLDPKTHAAVSPTH